MSYRHLINGVLVSEAELLISPRDLGFLRAFGVFDLLITYQKGQPFRLNDHIDRFFRSAEIISLHLPWDKAEVKEWVWRALNANADGAEKVIRIIASGGVGLDGMTQAAAPTFICMIEPRKAFAEQLYREGATLGISRHLREIPEAKSVNYIHGIAALHEARKTLNAVDVLYHDDQVYEAATSNIFAVIHGEIVTPKNRILKGVTRQVLLEILPPIYPVFERRMNIDELLGASEIFITASNKEVMPVTRIGERLIGDGKVGPVSHQAMKIFEDYTRSTQWFDMPQMAVA